MFNIYFIDVCRGNNFEAVVFFTCLSLMASHVHI